uniref:Odorant receptor 68 n=1 Tax=Chouioia cunea TaxID=1570515 RepID=A0A6B9CQ27_9HYME|nr:odorant receptor 68 [Chouioia cunea]
MRVVLPLMFLSLITFCTSVYNVSQSKNSGAEWFSFFIYLVCLLCQLCCYCWFGNELKLKSTAVRESIYNSDWTTLKPVDRKSLYLIMLSCQREMSISYHGFCTLTIDIFVWVLKTSYGAYNLLKTVE